MDAIGRKRWAIAEGYRPSESSFSDRALLSHETACILDDPQPVPRDTDYASVLESEIPIVVQHTRLDSRRAGVSLQSTIAYAEG